jgi:hypothetical protein
MRDLVSYTELSTLAKCEQMWAYRYRDKVAEPDERPVYFQKGTELHELIHAWWIGGDAQQRAEASFERRSLAAFEEFDDRLITMFDDVKWIYDRYTMRYGAMRARGELRVVETELKVVNPIPHSGVAAVTYVDQLVWLKDKGLYAVERKSMADWQRLDTLDVDPQVGIVLWQLRQDGWPVQGVLYDAIRTYRWKPEKPTQTALIEAEIESNPEFTSEYVTKREQTAWARLQLETHPGVERSIDDSFQWLTTDRTGANLAVLEDEMRTAVRRRAVLAAGELPMRNIGTTCRTCSYKNECHADLIFPELLELRYENAS